MGQSSNPYLPHYRTAFASSRLFLPAPQVTLPFLETFLSPIVGASLGPTRCTAKRAIQAYRLPSVSQIDGVRTPLYTGWYCECAGSLSKLACLTTVAILALEPNGSSSSAFLTICNDKASLTLSIPIISHRRASVLLAVLRFTECSAPHRCR